MDEKHDEDRVSIPLDAETALRALLAVDPDAEPSKEDEPANGDKSESTPRDNSE